MHIDFLQYQNLHELYKLSSNMLGRTFGVLVKSLTFISWWFAFI